MYAAVHDERCELNLMKGIRALVASVVFHLQLSNI
jgi:hypothetical protein